MKLKFLGFLFLFVSCNKDSSIAKDYMRINYEDINEKRVSFQDDLININNKVESYNFGDDSLKLLFIGEMGCSPCVIKLKEIEAFLKANTKYNKIVKTIYLGVGETSEYFDYQVKEGNFSFNIYSDEKSNFIYDNELFNYKKSTILLDKTNKIIFVGDLINNKSLKDFYSILIDENI